MSSETRSIESVAVCRNGAGIKQDHFAPVGTPLARVSDFSDGSIDLSACINVELGEAARWKSHALEVGDILIATVGSWPPNWSSVVGKSVSVPKEASGAIQNQNTICVRAIDGVADQRFLYYALHSKDFVLYAANAAHGSANQARLSMGSLLQYQLAVPPLTEQIAIGRTLGSLDDKIEANRRTGRALEGLARGVFKAWFVDFEPVKAKAAGATAFPGMPPETFATLPTRFTDSGLGLVPEGWDVGKLGDYTDINKNSIKAGAIDGEIEYVDIASVSVGQLSTVQRVDFADAPGRARRRVQHGDTIWSCVRPNRRSFLFVHSPPANRIASTGFAVISPKVLGAAYIYEATTRQEFVDYLVANADGSAYPAVRAEHFARADVLVPPRRICDAFEEMAMPLRDLIANGARESAKLAALRDYLLPRLLSGRVRVEAGRD